MEKLLFLTIFCYLSSTAVLCDTSCECGIEKISPRIINGINSPSGMFPWIVYLARQIEGREGSYRYCTGSIITDRHILTAGHCFKPKEEKLSKIGVWLFQGCGRRHKTHSYKPLRVIKVHTHPDYYYHNETSTSLSQNDLAVWELDQAFKFNKTFMPICFSRNNFNRTQDIKNLITSGWGKQNQGEDLVHSDCLQHTDLDIVSDHQCSKHYGRNRDMRKLICGGGSTTTCDGDSGGPLMTRNNGRVFEVGVTSFGRKDCGLKTGTPSGFERISFHMDWINNITGNQVCFK